ncbi:MAG: nuclear transport factor 2 family protein [Brevundimonas sp.]|uniref:nuclear transport factor 2 family protein n=1 Tax=Brevundimonas sp. TaxID=1871086 RepID=UPI003918F5AF
MHPLPSAVAAYIDAYNRMDVDGMLDCLTEDVAFTNLSDGAVTAQTRGRDEFRELALVGVSAFETRCQSVTNAISVAGTTVIQVDYSAVVGADLPNGWKKGQSLSLVGASLFRLRDDRIELIVDES